MQLKAFQTRWITKRKNRLARITNWLARDGRPRRAAPTNKRIKNNKMDWTTITSLVLTFVAGGGMFKLVTIGSKKKKAEAEAKTSELDNVQEAIKIWRDMAETLSIDLTKAREANNLISKQMNDMRSQVSSLMLTNDRILTMLNRMTCDNCKLVCEDIKNEINQ